MNTKLEAKISVGRLIQLSYASNQDMTAKILDSGASFSILYNPSTDEFKLTAEAGTVKFGGKKAIQGFGFKLKKASIYCTNGDGGIIKYTGSFSFYGVATISTRGEFDVYALILSCSGWLCQAARFLNSRDAQIRSQIEDAIR
ncbi:MAG: hypothetical protein P8X74_23230 [Reinekea sp.]